MKAVSVRKKTHTLSFSTTVLVNAQEHSFVVIGGGGKSQHILCLYIDRQRDNKKLKHINIDEHL
jgi:hypothetical protein